MTITVRYHMTCPGPGRLLYAYWAANRWQDPNRANDGRSDAGVVCPPT